jgi:hypothetical protein
MLDTGRREFVTPYGDPAVTQSLRAHSKPTAYVALPCLRNTLRTTGSAS